MPPLATVLLVVLAAIVIVRILAEFNNELPLPFMEDATHGICPQCGDSCPDAVEFGSINCHCGCTLEVHAGFE